MHNSLYAVISRRVESGKFNFANQSADNGNFCRGAPFCISIFFRAHHFPLYTISEKGITYRTAKENSVCIMRNCKNPKMVLSGLCKTFLMSINGFFWHIGTTTKFQGSSYQKLQYKIHTHLPYTTPTHPTPSYKHTHGIIDVERRMRKNTF